MLDDPVVPAAFRFQPLAHVNSDLVEAAYRRTDLFERRRLLMQEWAAYVALRTAPAGEGERVIRAKRCD